MMMNEEFEYIVSRVVDNAKDALDEYKLNKNDDFLKGKRIAYYEVIDTIKNELIARGQNLKDYNLDIDLEKLFI